MTDDEQREALAWVIMHTLQPDWDMAFQQAARVADAILAAGFRSTQEIKLEARPEYEYRIPHYKNPTCPYGCSKR